MTEQLELELWHLFAEDAERAPVSLTRHVPAASSTAQRHVGGDVGPSYGVGTRLLVSGEPRWGGAPLRDAIAWEGCGGFTRYFDKATADSWRATFD